MHLSAPQRTQVDCWRSTPDRWLRGTSRGGGEKQAGKAGFLDGRRRPREPAPNADARREEAEGRRKIEHGDVDRPLEHRRVHAPIVEPLLRQAVDLLFDHGRHNVLEHQQTSLAAPASAGANLAVSDALRLIFQTGAELVILDRKFRERRRFAGGQPLPLHAEFVEAARRVKLGSVAVEDVGKGVSHILVHGRRENGRAAAHLAAHLANEWGIPVLLVEAQLGAFQPGILDGRH